MSEQDISILVVDRDLTLRNAQVEMIKEMGYPNVYAASTGTQAWTLLKRHGADLIIAGWNLPELNGLTLLKIVRADSQFLATPFIMISELVTKSQVVEAGEAGVTDMLCRPITPQRFQEKIKSILALATDPQRLEAQRCYKEGAELMAQGRWEDALESFRRILGVYENAEIYYNMGFINTALERYEEAIVCFRKATEIDEAFGRAYQKIGECYLALGKEKEAEYYLQRAAEVYLEKERDPASAAMALKEVLKVNPNTINVFNTLGIVYRRQGKYQEAVNQYKRALRVSPQDENIFYNLGRTYYEMGDYVQAGKVLKKAVDINPNHADAQNLYKVNETKLAGMR